MIRRTALVLLTWMLTGMGAVGFSVLTSAGGTRWLFVGAAAGGAVASAASAWVASKLRLIATNQVCATATGGLLGFLVATPIAVSNLHTPVVPVLSTALAGLGAMFGSLRADATVPLTPR